MKKDQDTYDAAIIGGGLAGLSLAIQMARKGYSVVLFEKEKYPFHKVCGEYISMESWPFLLSLGLDLSALNLPKIDTLNLTAPAGRSFTTKLPLGGFGISRYTIDSMMAAVARGNGVEIMEETKVQNVIFRNNTFCIQYATPEKQRNWRLLCVVELTGKKVTSMCNGNGVFYLKQIRGSIIMLLSNTISKQTGPPQ